jgi:hypothetical protein
MTAKEILLKVAEDLPANATLLDAINEMEMFVGLEDRAEVKRSIREDVPAQGPAWLYESPSRLCAVLRQSRPMPAAAIRIVTE